MILSDNTLAVLKNFSQLNVSLHVLPGNTIKTITPSKSVFASFAADDTFDTEFAIYELPRFLSCLALLDGPELVFHDDRIEMRKGGQVVTYRTCNPEMVQSAAKINVKQLSHQTKFPLTRADLAMLKKAAMTLKLDTIRFYAETGAVYMAAKSSGNPKADGYRKVIGEGVEDFSVEIDIENMKMLDDDYAVGIQGRFVEFQGKVRYVIGAKKEEA